ncbi:MAG: response regulator [Proteobacteria bacterium]|nr:response regulator [Pseudomonadota bacterium]
MTPAPPNISERTSPLVLIVDDEPRGRDLLEALLRPLGCRLEFATDGRQAYNRTVALQPDLVLLDVMMPELDGFEVCRLIRANPLVAEVPVVMVTALDDRGSRLAGIQAGADDFLNKPIEGVEVRARVTTITRLNRYRRLQTERNKFSFIAETSPDGYCVVNHDDELTYANAQARRRLGLTPEDSLAGKFFTKLAHEHYRLEPVSNWSNWARQKAASPLYMVRTTAAGEALLWLEVDELPLPDGQGRLLRLHDITEPLTNQRDIWKFHKAVSHKLRTPLNGLCGPLELLVTTEASVPFAEVTDLAQIALESANRFEKQISEVLNFVAPPATVRAPSTTAMASLPTLLRPIQVNLGILFVDLDLPAELRTHCVPLPEAALEVILAELLENARKFHPRHQPKITIKVTRGDGGWLAIQVADDGLTLSPGELELVWTPYYQVEKNLTGEVDGMGLGLPMIASLIWEAGGSCRMSNRPAGAGVIVELVLPSVPQ